MDLHSKVWFPPMVASSAMKQCSEAWIVDIRLQWENFRGENVCRKKCFSEKISAGKRISVRKCLQVAWAGLARMRPDGAEGRTRTLGWTSTCAIFYSSKRRAITFGGFRTLRGGERARSTCRPESTTTHLLISSPTRVTSVKSQKSQPAHTCSANFFFSGSLPKSLHQKSLRS